MEINKVIIPAAGLATRFLPFSKAIPKEMIPLLNTPAIQYGVEEAVHSHLNQCIFITRKGKESITNHFDHAQELDDLLKERKQENYIAGLKKIIRSLHCTYIRQPEPLGLGHALLMARHMIAPKEYFGVLLPDDIIIHQEPALLQLMRIARQEKATVIAIQEIPEEFISAYGVISIKKQITPSLFQIQNVVEKPQKKDAPSNLAIVGRYIFSQKIFSALDSIQFTGHEMQLTDGINTLIHQGEKVLAYKIQGIRYDVGNPLGWLKANLGMALQHPQYASHLKEFIKNLDTIHSFKYNNSNNLSEPFSE